MLCDSEILPLRKTGEIGFNIFKRKMPKRIFRSRKDDRIEEWRKSPSKTAKSFITLSPCIT